MRIKLDTSKVPQIHTVVLAMARVAATPHAMVREKVQAIATLFAVDSRTVIRWADEEPELSLIVRGGKQ